MTFAILCNLIIKIFKLVWQEFSWMSWQNVYYLISWYISSFLTHLFSSWIRIRIAEFWKWICKIWYLETNKLSQLSSTKYLYWFKERKSTQYWPTSEELWFVMPVGTEVLWTRTKNDLGKVDTYLRHIPNFWVYFLKMSF